jgi:flagellar hook-associated protein 1 FlgK
MSLRPVQSTTDPSKIDIAYLNGNKLSTIQQSSLQGGNLGAYLTFRDQSLEPARNALGRVAIGLADSINQQNRMGLDLNGVPGSNLFNIASPRVDNGALNTGTAVVTGAISDVSALTASDYRLSFNGTNYSMLRLSDNAVTDLGTTLPLAAVDGVTITVAGTMNAADSFLIRPTANAAGDLRVLTNDPAKIAAATPIRTSAALSNTGSANISSGTVNTPLPLDQNLLAPVKIVFNQPPTSYSLASTAASIGADIPDPVDPLVTGPTSVVTVSSTVNMAAGDPVAGGGFPAGTTILSIDSDGVTFVVQMPVGEATNPPAPATGQTLQIGSYAYTPGADISYNGWTLQISGTPNAGDTFDIAQNINASGDNRNVLLMADLQVQNLLVNGTVSFQGAYSQLVGEIGAKTHELDVTSQAQTAMLAHTIASQQSISGVNLDEEAANLLRYQHAYQAAAKAMQIAETMFDALLSLGR